MKKTSTKKTINSPKYTWNLSLLYKSANDPKIEEDIVSLEKSIISFSQKYNTESKIFLNNDEELLSALKDFEILSASPGAKAILYFFYTKDLDATNTEASAKLSLLEDRLNKSLNNILFFPLYLGKLSRERQGDILKNNNFSHFKVFLQRTFDDAKYNLSLPEEKIMSLKDLTAHSMWVSATERILNKKTVLWKGKQLPLPTAMQMVANLSSEKDRKKLSGSINLVLGEVAPFAEAEINAIYTDKKTNDELRGYKTAYEATTVGYRNDPKVVEMLRKVVSEHMSISHDFYKLKAKLLKQKRLGYYDRNAKIGTTRTKYTFEDTLSRLKNVFGSIDPKFKGYIETYISKGEIDVYPRTGKTGGAYCSSSFNIPTFILLNHTDDLRSFTTCAHELGHAFHGEFSKSQGALYCDYSTSLAETASTLFEAIAFKSIYDSLPDTEKIVILHERISDDISTVFRQMACFNFELDLHATIREKGYIPKEEIANIHNKNMSGYLGKIFEMKMEDGYFFVSWSHIRNYFYVYTYAYGALVSKAMLRKYHKDPSFWKNIEQFLSAGGKDSPENILKEIGLDVYSPEFFKEGLMEIADDVKELERLMKKMK